MTVFELHRTIFGHAHCANAIVGDSLNDTQAQGVLSASSRDVPPHAKMPAVGIEALDLAILDKKHNSDESVSGNFATLSPT